MSLAGGGGFCCGDRVILRVFGLMFLFVGSKWKGMLVGCGPGIYIQRLETQMHTCIYPDDWWQRKRFRHSPLSPPRQDTTHATRPARQIQGTSAPAATWPQLWRGRRRNHLVLGQRLWWWISWNHCRRVAWETLEPRLQKSYPDRSLVSLELRRLGGFATFYRSSWDKRCWLIWLVRSGDLFFFWQTGGWQLTVNCWWCQQWSAPDLRLTNRDGRPYSTKCHFSTYPGIHKFWILNHLIGQLIDQSAIYTIYKG